MNYFILFVLHDHQDFDQVLSAWEEVGVKGITILTSTGIGRMRQTALREDMPLIPHLEDLLSHTEVHNHTIFTVVNEEAMVDRVVEATQGVVGDMNEPNSGILIVLPVARAYGLQRR